MLDFLINNKGFEYEFTATFIIDQKSSMATVQKDNTHLFENEGDIKLTEAHGKKIIQWANSGEGYTPPVRSSKTPTDELISVKEEVITLCKKLGGSENEELMKAIKKIEPSGNPNKIKEMKKLQELLETLKTIKPLKEVKKEAKKEVKKEGA